MFLISGLEQLLPYVLSVDAVQLLPALVLSHAKANSLQLWLSLYKHSLTVPSTYGHSSFHCSSDTIGEKS